MVELNLSKYQKLFPANINHQNASVNGLSESMEFGLRNSIPVQTEGRGACAHGYEEAQPWPTTHKLMGWWTIIIIPYNISKSGRKNGKDWDI